MASPLHIGLNGVSFAYPNGHRVLTDISFAVPSGSVTGLIGENGAGKSTLLSLISGERVPSAGTIITPTITGFIAQETSLPFTESASSLIDAAVDELRGVDRAVNAAGDHRGDHGPRDVQFVSERTALSTRSMAAVTAPGASSGDM